jgi:hypothetical protein
MFRLFPKPLRVQLDDNQSTLCVDYQPTGAKPLFDICDEEGRILKSGHFEPGKTRIKVSDLLNSVYVFLVLDGDRIRTRRFEISR